MLTHTDSISKAYIIVQVSCPHLEGCRVPENEDGYLQPHKLADHHQGTVDTWQQNQITPVTVRAELLPLVQDDSVVVSPRIDTLDCNDLGPYLPHGLGSVNTMMLGASVCSLYN